MAPEWATALPVPLTRLVGRDAELARLQAQLQDGDSRLLTVTGPGGVGKTLLVLGLAADVGTGFDTAAFVSLSAVRSVDLVPATVVAAIGLGSLENADGALRAFVARRRMLLILDGVEQLPAVGTTLVDLLASAPALTVVVTSRALLRVTGERDFAVTPLSVPGSSEISAAVGVSSFGAVQLFGDRGAGRRADLRGDRRKRGGRGGDLPAAGRSAARDRAGHGAAEGAVDDRPAGPAARSPAGAHVGCRDQPERLRTMRACIAWSYDLLHLTEQSVFRRLAMFSGGCSLAAVESTIDDVGDPLDLVEALVDESLLHATASAVASRVDMLGVIAEFALEQLRARGEEPAARRAHAANFRQLAEDGAIGLRGATQQRWRDALEEDLNNLRAALEWTLAQSSDPADAETGLQLAGALWYFWFQRGLTGEARRWLGLALDRAQSRGRDRARALLGAGTLAWRQADAGGAREHLDEGADLWREIDDPAGPAETLQVLGHVAFDPREGASARRLFDESSAAYGTAGDRLGALPIVGDLGLVAYHEGDYARAETVLLESLEQYRENGLKDRAAGALNVLGDLALLAADLDRATGRYEESLALWRELRGSPGVASALHKLGQASRTRLEYGAARAQLLESLELQVDLGNRQGIGECLAGLAGVAADAGDVMRATEILAAGTALLDAIGVPLAPVDRLTLDRDIDATRARMGPAQWETAWSTGRFLTMEQAVELARTEETPSDPTTGPAPADTAASAPPDVLSRRGREVGTLLSQGMSNREIAAALTISERTVGSHIDHIMTKLGVRSRTRVALWAINHGLGEPPPR